MIRSCRPCRSSEKSHPLGTSLPLRLHSLPATHTPWLRGREAPSHSLLLEVITTVARVHRELSTSARQTRPALVQSTSRSRRPSTPTDDIALRRASSRTVKFSFLAHVGRLQERGEYGVQAGRPSRAQTSTHRGASTSPPSVKSQSSVTRHAVVNASRVRCNIFHLASRSHLAFRPVRNRSSNLDLPRRPKQLQ